MPQVGRRKFLLASLGGAAALASGTVAWERSRQGRDEQPITRRAWALGSDVTLTILGTSPENAQRAIDAALTELEVIENVMSLYRPESQLCTLNRERRLTAPHPHLVTVLTEAASVSRASQGAFDVTVQPLWELFATAQQQGRVPSDDEIAATRASIDWQAIEVRSQEVRLNAPAKSVTLNGIAQGFAADRVVAVLKDHGVEHALINAGEIGSLGSKPDGQGWKVGVQHPRQKDAYVALARLQGRALSTSGDYATTFSPDFAQNHIFDPLTGKSPRELASVSVVAPTAMQADALSTAAMVLGPDRAIELIQSRSNVDALLVLKSGRVFKTPGFPEIADIG